MVLFRIDLDGVVVLGTSWCMVYSASDVEFSDGRPSEPRLVKKGVFLTALAKVTTTT